MTKDYFPEPQKVNFPGHELGKGRLNRIGVDVSRSAAARIAKSGLKSQSPDVLPKSTAARGFYKVGVGTAISPRVEYRLCDEPLKGLLMAIGKWPFGLLADPT